MEEGKEVKEQNGRRGLTERIERKKSIKKEESEKESCGHEVCEEEQREEEKINEEQGEKGIK